jgi:uncharacterized membrane protein
VAQELTSKPPPSGKQRVAEAAACGAVTAAIAVWFVPWQLTVLLAWDIAAAAILVRAWLHLQHFDADDTRRWATREDDDPRGAEVMLVISGSVSLVGVAFAFLEANSAGTSDAMGVILRVAGVLTIALSWGVIHTVFALRYARLYYSEQQPGAIDFKEKGYQPNYRDFAYFAFTVGMTYQVSDTDIHSHQIRRTVLKHALLSFFFGTVILATTVNLIANLLND